jgi:hypothetical protein
MANQFLQTVAIATGAATLTMAAIAAPAQALDFSFSQSFTDSLGTGTLSGSFSGVDANSNNRIDASEFSSFSSSFSGSNLDGSNFDLGNFSLGLADLASFSYFASPTDYSFSVTNVNLFPADPLFTGRGWSSGLNVGNVGQTDVGYVLTANIIEGVYLAQEPLSFAVIPTPALLPGLIGFGLSVWRQRQA